MRTNTGTFKKKQSHEYLLIFRSIKKLATYYLYLGYVISSRFVVSEVVSGDSFLMTTSRCLPVSEHSCDGDDVRVVLR